MKATVQQKVTAYMKQPLSEPAPSTAPSNKSMKIDTVEVQREEEVV